MYFAFRRASANTMHAKDAKEKVQSGSHMMANAQRHVRCDECNQLPTNVQIMRMYTVDGIQYPQQTKHMRCPKKGYFTRAHGLYVPETLNGKDPYLVGYEIADEVRK